MNINIEYIHIYIYIYIYIYTYTHTYIHVYTPMHQVKHTHDDVNKITLFIFKQAYSPND